MKNLKNLIKLSVLGLALGAASSLQAMEVAIRPAAEDVSLDDLLNSDLAQQDADFKAFVQSLKDAPATLERSNPAENKNDTDFEQFMREFATQETE